MKQDDPIKLRFPLWEYLNQPIFSSTYKTILNPLKFWHKYQVELLERCWIQDHVQLLENCWIQVYRLEK